MRKPTNDGQFHGKKKKDKRRQTTIYKTLHWKLNLEQHERHQLSPRLHVVNIVSNVCYLRWSILCSCMPLFSITTGDTSGAGTAYFFLEHPSSSPLISGIRVAHFIPTSSSRHVFETPPALEYRINWEIYTQYVSAAGILLHINRYKTNLYLNGIMNLWLQFSKLYATFIVKGLLWFSRIECCKYVTSHF
jgi:hypothetical protein